MTPTQGNIPLRYAALLALLLPVTSIHAHAEKWTEPTQEELKMTSQSQMPGAAAVYLYREEMTDDKLHMFSIFIRPSATKNARCQLRSTTHTSLLDAVQVSFPASFTVESIPTGEKLSYQSAIAYGLRTESTPTGVTVRREFALGEILYMPE